jgi:exodeoxyribonuclease-3
MRIATWNVNGLRARLGFVRLWLEARQPDIVALQELKLSDEHFPHRELAELGYEAAVLGQKAWNGVAVLARRRPAVETAGLPGQEAMGSRLLSARVGDLLVTSVYCPNGKHVAHDDYERKLAWFDALAAHLEGDRSGAGPHVLLGDFNICPGSLDSWDPDGLAGTIFHTDAERRRLQAVLDRGLCDLYRHLRPEEREFSWWDYRGGAFHRGRGLRIDLVLASDDLIPRTRRAEIDRDWRKKRDGLTPSDHAPVVVDVDL